MRQCVACGSSLPEWNLFELDNAPASAQDIPDKQQVKADKGIHLSLCQCVQCGLVQFACSPVGYYKEVIRAGGYSGTMRELRRKQYRHLIDTYHLENKKFLEVGCGRGEFLQVLTEFPVKVYGIEDKAELVKVAKKNNLHVWKDFADDIYKIFADEDVTAPYDVFLSFNFLEHQPHPGIMLSAIYNNLSEHGIGLITVPSLEYILENGSYYELIRDHIAYYSFDTLRKLLERYGFEVLEEEMINRDTISMIVKKIPVLSEFTTHMPHVCASADVSGIQAGYIAINREIDELLKRLAGENRRIAIWGASHQGFTLASTTGLSNAVSYIIDSAPFKQGRFAPASHIPIVAPDYFLQDPVDVILIVAPGYTDEIAGIVRCKFGENIELLTLRTNYLERI